MSSFCEAEWSWTNNGDLVPCFSHILLGSILAVSGIVGVVYFLQLRKSARRLHVPCAEHPALPLSLLISTFLIFVPLVLVLVRTFAAEGSAIPTARPYEIFFIAAHTAFWIFTTFLLYFRWSRTLGMLTPVKFEGDGGAMSAHLRSQDGQGDIYDDSGQLSCRDLFRTSNWEKSRWPLTALWLLAFVVATVRLRSMMLHRFWAPTSQTPQEEELGSLWQLISQAAMYPLYILLPAMGLWTMAQHEEQLLSSRVSIEEYEQTLAEHEDLLHGRKGPDYRTLYAKSREGIRGEANAGCLSRWFMCWFSPVISYNQTINIDELDVIGPSDDARRLLQEFLSVMDNTVRLYPHLSSASCIRRSLWRLTRKSLLAACGLRLISDALQFIGVLALSEAIGYCDERFADGSYAPFLPNSYGYLMAALLFVAAALRALFQQNYLHIVVRQGMRVRALGSSLVFHRMLRMPAASKRLSVPHLQQILGNHLRRLEMIFWFGCHLIFAPLEVIGILLLLAHLLGWASALAGVGTLLLLLPLQALLARSLGAASTITQTETERRWLLTRQAFSIVRMLKLSAWEGAYWRKINETREKELGLLMRVRMLQALSMLGITCAPVLVSVSAFVVYAFTETEPLTARQAFTSLSLFAIIRVPLFVLPRVFQYANDATVATQQLGALLDTGHVGGPPESGDSTISGGTALSPGEVHIPPTVFRHTPTAAPALVINELRVGPGEMMLITGKPGSGKSLLLRCLLGEMYHSPAGANSTAAPQCTRAFFAPDAKIAYVGQHGGWTKRCTVKDNILFGRPYIASLYRETIRACCLGPDLDELPSGDMTELGEVGFRLSPEQLQRMTLARAVYGRREADIFLFDEPFSYMHPDTAAKIFEDAIARLLEGKTCILVSKELQFAPHSDRIAVLDRPEATTGSRSTDPLPPMGIVELGNFDELMTRQGAFRRIYAQYEADTQEETSSARVNPFAMQSQGDASSSGVSPGGYFDPGVGSPPRRRRPGGGGVQGVGGGDRPRANGVWSDDEEEDITLSDPRTRPNLRRTSSLFLHYTDSDTQSQGAIEEAKADKPYVPLEYYWLYWRKCSVALAVPVVLATVLGLVALRTADYVISQWTDDTFSERNSVDTYVIWYTSLCGGAVFLSLLGAVVTSCWGLRGARTVHAELVSKLMRAPLSYFDQTPLARVLNSCSADVEAIDKELPDSLYQLMHLYLELFTILIVVCIVAVYFSFALVPLIGIFFWIQKYHRSTSQQLKRLEQGSRGPLQDLLRHVFLGITTIRAYDATTRLEVENGLLVNAHTRAFWAVQCLHRWLALRLELLGAFFLFAVAMFVVATREQINAGLVGLALSYAFNITGRLNWVVRQSMDLEHRVKSVQRTQKCSQVDAEGYPHIDSTDPEWQLRRVKSDAATLKNHYPPTEMGPAASSAFSSRAELAPADWPRSGNLDFRSVAVRYEAGGPLVLKGVSVRVDPGEKVGVVGRPGAGKSALVRALFRATECERGQVNVDLLDISQVTLRKLRSSLALIPADPVLVSGSIRENLDIYEQHSDRALWNALAHVELREYVEGLQGGLASPVMSDHGEEHLTETQARLLNIAATLLRGCKIVVMEEGANPAAPQVWTVMSRLMREQFLNTTMLIIAHRLSTVASVLSCDNILVMDDGRVVEFGSVQDLLRQRMSLFVAMAQEEGVYRK